MTSCLGVRIGAAAIVGYSLGAFAGSATVAWVLAAVAATGMYLWSRLGARRTGAACGTGCAPPRSRRWRRSAGRGVPMGEDGPVAVGGRSGTAEPRAPARPVLPPEPDRVPIDHRS